MTFREKLHNDLDGISPSDELLSKVSQMMAEEAKKPKQPIYLNVAKWGAMAAAVCLIAVGAVSFFGKGSESTTPDIAVADASGWAREIAYSPDVAAENMDSQGSSACIEDDIDSAEAYSLENEEAVTLCAEAYCKGNKIPCSDDEINEILKLIESYIAENEYAMLDLAMHDTEIHRYKDNGLYICINMANKNKSMVLIDDNSSYIFYNWDFYSLDSDTKAEFLKYAE